MGTLTTKDLAEKLNDNCAFGVKLSATLKLCNAVKNGDVLRVRNYLSAFGKSKQGFDELAPDIRKQAMKIMEDNGYFPAGKYRTSTFTIVKITK